MAGGHPANFLEILGADVTAVVEGLDLLRQCPECCRRLARAAERCFQRADLVGVGHVLQYRIKPRAASTALAKAPEWLRSRQSCDGCQLAHCRDIAYSGPKTSNSRVGMEPRIGNG